MMTCPNCGKLVKPEHFSCCSGAKAGRAGTGKVKARTREQARAAALVGVAKRRERKLPVVKATGRPITQAEIDGKLGGRPKGKKK